MSFPSEFARRALSASVSAMGTSPLGVFALFIYPVWNLILAWKRDGFAGMKQHWKERLQISLLIAIAWWGAVFAYQLFYNIPHEIYAEAARVSYPNATSLPRPPEFWDKKSPLVIKSQAPEAIMGWTHDGNNGLEIFNDPQDGWSVNVWCTNIGALVTAINVACTRDAKVIPANNGTPSNETLRKHWKAFFNLVSRQLPTFKRVDMEPRRRFFGTVNLNMANLDPGLSSGDKVILVIAATFYADGNGNHETELCEWAQAPFNPSHPIWHFCEIGHNKKVY